jgi:nucleotide-binding universal stress UspA family protein
MFKHILVPLDGSRLAESVLPAANYIAQKMHAAITLIHVIEKNAPEEVHGERHLTDAEEANRYLSDIAAGFFSLDLLVKQHVHTSEVNNVSRSIVDHVDELAPDLIIMCTHGRGGLHDFLVGSIAQQVIAMGKTPVMLIHPQENGEPAPFNCGQLLVPLDSTPDHELSIPVASSLAHICQSSIHMLIVVPTLGDLKGKRAATGKLLPGTMTAMLEMAEENAQQYLSDHAVRLKDQGLHVITEVSRGDPADRIIETGERIKADLILLVTHGRIGQEAFWAGSVAPRVSGSSRIPLLLVPVRESA